jgi:heterodisulfide reductase subunit A-like polyferredoxin
MKIIDKDYNAQTGEETITERAETLLEKDERQKLEQELIVLQNAMQSKEAARKAVLDKLGLSADEVAALLG